MSEDTNKNEVLKLKNLLQGKFSDADLRSLTFDLEGVDYDELSGDTKTLKIQSLLEFLENRGRLGDIGSWIEVNRGELISSEDPKPSKQDDGDQLPSGKADQNTTVENVSGDVIGRDKIEGDQYNAEGGINFNEEHHHHYSSETQPPRPAPVFSDQLSFLGQVSGSVAAITVYVLAVSGRLFGPFPNITATLTVIISTILLWRWRWRWSHITQLKPLDEKRILTLPSFQKPPTSQKLIDKILDPARLKSTDLYVLSLFWRRAELTGLLFLSLFAMTWIPFQVPNVLSEILGTPQLSCVGSETNKLRIVIAEFNKAESESDLLLEDRLFDSLASQTNQNVTVCRSENILRTRSEARIFGEKARATLLIWGRIDVLYEVHIEASNLSFQGHDLPVLPSDIATNATFQIREPEFLSFVTEFTLVEIFYLDNQIEEAQTLLQEILIEADQGKFGVAFEQELSKIYFFLGFMFDPLNPGNPNPDADKAIKAYTDANKLNPELHSAILNRGMIFLNIGNEDDAFNDFSILIEQKSWLSSSAYVNRALLQSTRPKGEEDFELAINLNPFEGHFHRGHARLKYWNDPEGAIEDFEKIIEMNPKEFFFYHLLGQAQLMASQFDSAKDTYQRMTVYLTEDTRQKVIDELAGSPQYQNIQDAEKVVEEIVEKLRIAEISN